VLGLGKVAAEHVQVGIEAGVLLAGFSWLIHSTAGILDGIDRMLRLWRWLGGMGWVLGDILGVGSKLVYKHGLLIWLCVLTCVTELVGIVVNMVLVTNSIHIILVINIILVFINYVIVIVFCVVHTVVGWWGIIASVWR